MAVREFTAEELHYLGLLLEKAHSDSDEAGGPCLGCRAITALSHAEEEPAPLRCEECGHEAARVLREGEWVVQSLCEGCFQGASSVGV